MERKEMRAEIRRDSISAIGGAGKMDSGSALHSGESDIAGAAQKAPARKKKENGQMMAFARFLTGKTGGYPRESAVHSLR